METFLLQHVVVTPSLLAFVLPLEDVAAAFSWLSFFFACRTGFSNWVFWLMWLQHTEHSAYTALTD